MPHGTGTSTHRQRCPGWFENIPKPFFASHTAHTLTHDHIRRTHRQTSRHHPVGGQCYHRTILFLTYYIFTIFHCHCSYQYTGARDGSTDMRYDRFRRQDLNAAACDPNRTNNLRKSKFSPPECQQPTVNISNEDGVWISPFRSAMRDV